MSQPDPISLALCRLLESRGATTRSLADDRVEVRHGDRRVEVYLDNLRRRVAQGESLDRVTEDFAARILSQPPPLSRDNMRTGLRLMVERLDVTKGTDMVVRPISETLGISLIWIDEDPAGFRFVSNEHLSRAELEEPEAWALAGDHMDEWLSTVRFEVREALGAALAWVAADNLTPFFSQLKASLVTAPSLRSHLPAGISWPIVAVMPCRDFLYIAPEGASELVGRLGPTVIREFSNSPYPLSTEVFSLSDAGIRAVGRFA